MIDAASTAADLHLPEVTTRTGSKLIIHSATVIVEGSDHVSFTMKGATETLAISFHFEPKDPSDTLDAPAVSLTSSPMHLAVNLSNFEAPFGSAVPAMYIGTLDGRPLWVTFVCHTFGTMRMLHFNASVE